MRGTDNGEGMILGLISSLPMGLIVPTRNMTTCYKIVINNLGFQIKPFIWISFLLWVPKNMFSKTKKSQSQWSSGLRRVSKADRLLGLRVRIPPAALMSCKCCVLSGRGLATWRADPSSRVLPTVVCNLETSGMRRPWPTLGCSFWWARGFLCFACSGIWYLLPWLQVQGEGK